MRVGEVARRAGVTVRALRYYEALGLVVPSRLANGYRDYDRVSVRQVEEIRALTGLGLSVEDTRAFVECLAGGHSTGDDCPASLAAYRRAIDQLLGRITAMAQRRDALAAHLEAAAGRALPSAAAGCPWRVAEEPSLPGDDDAAARLSGVPMPPVTLPASDDSMVSLDALGTGRTVLYVYPLTGRPGSTCPGAGKLFPVRVAAPRKHAVFATIMPGCAASARNGCMACLRRPATTRGN